MVLVTLDEGQLYEGVDGLRSDPFMGLQLGFDFEIYCNIGKMGRNLVAFCHQTKEYAVVKDGCVLGCCTQIVLQVCVL